MVVRVRQAMIVPVSVQGGANGCMVANHLQSSRDQCLQVAMEKKLKGVVENGRQAGPESVLAWQRAASESSISSMDSLPAGESLISQTDINPFLNRKARLGLHTSESDEELISDSLQEDFMSSKKLRRPLVGGSMQQPHPASSINVDEGDPEAGLVTTNRDFPVYFEGGKHFRVRISQKWLASARKVSSGLDDHNESYGSGDAFLPRGSALSNLADGFPSCKAPTGSESLPNIGYRVESHPGSCSVGMGSVGPDHGSTPSEDGKDPSSRVKFMCSFGGKILPRPLDGRLRYVGGDTKIVAVHRDTNFEELMAKMTEVYGQDLTLKYQLPNEDLDALISVSSDEDLENMMEEYDKLERGDGSSRLRVFLFPVPVVDNASSHHKDSAADSRNNEQRYVDAVNGIPEVGSRNRMESSHVSGVPRTFSVENLMALDAPENWVVPRGPDSVVPVALLAHEAAPSHVHRVPVAVPVSTITSRSNAPSAPSSAPSSPPLLPRPVQGKLPLVTDVHMQYHQDTHVKMGTPYNVLVAEGNYQDNESFGGSGASSGASQHDTLHRSSDSRRGPDSPPRKQHDGGHQDHSLRTEQQRRLSETKVPRVSSHGKLTRLMEHHELAPSSESQQLSDVHLPSVEMQRLLQQQQQQILHQPVWQHPKESQQDSYRRADLLPQNVMLGQQQQGYQLQPLGFRSGLPQVVPAHDSAVYRQGDQHQQQFPEEALHKMPRAVSSHNLAPGMPPGQSSAYHVGSAPSSPRLSFREVPQRHVPSSQQLPIHWPYSSSAFADQPPYGRRVNYGDQAGRSFRLSNSPPKYRDHSTLAEERLLRQQHQQQTLGNVEPVHHEQVPKSAQLLYDANPGGQPYDLLSRSQVPLYKGLNPFQEKFIAYQEHQEIGDGRRHQLPQQGIDGQFLSGQQQLHALHQNQRLEYQDPLLQSVEHGSGNPRYQETQLKGPEWDSDEARQKYMGRPRTRPSDDDILVDPGVSHQRDIQQANYPGLHLPETSDDLLSSSMGDFTSGHNKNDRLDHPGSSNFQFRPGMLPPSSLGSYSGGAKPRPNPTESSGFPRYLARSNESDYLAPGALKAGGNGQDLRPSFEINGHQQTSSSLGQVLQFPHVSHRLMEERPVPMAFNPILQQLPNSRLGDNVMMGSDIRWNGGLGPEDARGDVPVQGREHLGSLYEERLKGLPNLAIGRGARLSRPSSSTNIPNLLEEIEPVHVQPYGVQGRVSNLMDEGTLHPNPVDGIASIENSIFTTGVCTGMSMFENTRPASSSIGYQNLVTVADLPNIKTIATQVPSVEGDDSGGSTSTTVGSDRSLSSGCSGEIFSGRMTMTQHLAEDMASCVLESSPVKAGSQVQVKQGDSREDGGPVEGSTIWPLDTAPTLSPSLWENALDEAVDGHDDEKKHAIGEESIESRATPTSMAKDAVLEDSQVELENEKEGSTVKNAADAAADEAIAHGLQTIKNADLEELRELGSGTFGTVYHGKWRGTDVAIKRIKASCFAGRPSEQERLIADFWREACNLGNLHHPNVVAFYGVVSDGPGGTLATVTEYMVNGSLKQVLQKKDRTIDRRKRLMIAMDSAFGMEYLHGKNIVHFDLKCENLLVNMRDPHRPICKVGDLGLSKVKHQTMVSGGVRGTLPWMAPELLNGSSSLVNEKVDIFSFGIVMWELLTGEEPYANMHYGAIIGGIVNNTLRPPPPSWCDPGWRSLMERCWSADPASRPTFSEIASELRAMSEGLKPKSQPNAQGQQPPSMHIQA